MGTLTIPGAVPIVMECETGKVSDGYHTFDELYDHRCLLFCVATALNEGNSQWKSRKHHDGSSFDGWFIAGLLTHYGPISYHIPDKYWDLCKAEERDTAPEWDGHTSQDVIERLTSWLNG
jgi:hypothetical protein